MPKCTLEQLVRILEIIIKTLGYEGRIEKLAIRPVGTHHLITFDNN